MYTMNISNNYIGIWGVRYLYVNLIFRHSVHVIVLDLFYNIEFKLIDDKM